jgi:hypothetical protein
MKDQNFTTKDTKSTKDPPLLTALTHIPFRNSNDDEKSGLLPTPYCLLPTFNLIAYRFAG